MDPPYDLICVGDTMIECIVSLSSLPLANQPLVIDPVHQQFGGSAFNLCWYFRQLAHRPLLLGPAGAHNKPLIDDAIAEANLDGAGLIPIDADTDFLLVMQVTGKQYTLYIRAHLPSDIDTRILAHRATAPYIVLAGSRHPRIRKALVSLAEQIDGSALAFTPSYPIYQFSIDELQMLLNKAHISIFNEDEAAYVVQKLGIENERQLAERVPRCLIVTRTGRGADLYEYGVRERIGSYSQCAEDIIGAGDAFFAGFLHSFLKGATLSESAHYGAALAAICVDARKVRVSISQDEIRQKLALPCQLR